MGPINKLNGAESGQVRDRREEKRMGKGETRGERREIIFQSLEGSETETIVESWPGRTGLKGEIGQVVPSRGLDPGKLSFLTLGADKASGISDTESANGSDVSEERIIHLRWNKTSRKGDLSLNGVG